MVHDGIGNNLGARCTFVRVESQTSALIEVNAPEYSGDAGVMFDLGCLCYSTIRSAFCGQLFGSSRAALDSLNQVYLRPELQDCQRISKSEPV